MPRIEVRSMSVEDIANNLNMDMFRDAARNGMSLSAYLELANPTDPDDTSGLDAFGRVLKHLGIVTRSVPSMGIQATTWEDAFEGSPQRRLLGVEFVQRKWRETIHRQPANTAAMQRATISSDDFALGSLMRPYTIGPEGGNRPISPQIPLSEIVATSIGIRGNAYKAAYFDPPSANDMRMLRVGEQGEIPLTTIRLGEREVQLWKFARGVRVTYEVLRRETLDRVARIVQRMAIQAENDKVATAINVLINGDGNAGTAAQVVNLTDLDPSITSPDPARITLFAWHQFKKAFTSPFALTTVLGQSLETTYLEMLAAGTGNPMLATSPLGQAFGYFRPINPDLSYSPALGWTSDAPAGRLIGFDNRFALERVYEIGADIQEIERRASNQTESLYMSEVEGYSVPEKGAVKIINLTA